MTAAYGDSILTRVVGALRTFNAAWQEIGQATGVPLDTSVIREDVRFARCVVFEYRSPGGRKRPTRRQCIRLARHARKRRQGWA